MFLQDFVPHTHTHCSHGSNVSHVSICRSTVTQSSVYSNRFTSEYYWECTDNSFTDCTFSKKSTHKVYSGVFFNQDSVVKIKVCVTKLCSLFHPVASQLTAATLVQSLLVQSFLVQSLLEHSKKKSEEQLDTSRTF